MNKFLFSLCVLFNFFIIYLPVSGETEVYIVNKQKSKVNFSIKHMQFQTVEGSFLDFSGEFCLESNCSKQTKGQILVESIDTGIKMRDKHLLSEEIFNAKTYPNISFQLDSLSALSNGTGNALGSLTIKGITKEISAILQDVQIDNENRTVSFVGETSISRKDFDVVWKGAVKESVVSDKVNIQLYIVGDK